MQAAVQPKPLSGWQRQKKAIAVAAFFIVLAGIGVSGVFISAKSKVFGTGSVVIDNDTKLRVDVAATPATLEQGLSGREGLAADEGMVFLFPAPGRYAFWMKDMRFPIDIIWIADGKIVDLTPEIPPPTGFTPLDRYLPIVPADTVLEVQSGFIKAHALRTGLPISVTVDKK